jgi:hypothetical protein
MTSEHLQRAAMNIVLDSGASVAQLGRYEARFEAARDRPGEPLPCPWCYMGGKIARLRAIDAPVGTGTVQCETCRQELSFSHLE